MTRQRAGRTLGLVTLAWLAWFGTGSAIAAPLGDPPVVRHAPDMLVDSQVFAIVQDHSGLVHLGMGNGLLSHDGERWTELSLPNGDMVRSLAVDEQGRVLVGGYGAFGYLRSDEFGRQHFVDLTEQALPWLQGRELADIWDVAASAEGVWFRALRDVFLWNPDDNSIRHWHHPGRFGVLVVDADGRALLQFRGEGLRHFADGQWLPLPDTATLTELVFAALPVPLAPEPDGAERGGGLLTLGTDGRWHRLIGERLWPQAMPAGLPPSSRFEHGLGLADGSLALAGSDGVLYLVDQQLSGWRSLPVDSGFLSGIVPASGGGLLIAADGGFYHVDWPGEWTVIDARHGIRGNLAALAEWNGQRYLLSGAGAARLQAEPQQPIRVQPLDWTDRALHALQPLDDRRALLAENHKLLLLVDDQVSELTQELVYPREFHRSQQRPDRVYIATELGLRFVDVDGDSLQLSPAFPDSREIRVLGVAENGPDELWFGTGRHGLWRIRLDAQGQIADTTVVALPGAESADGGTVLLSRLADGRVIVDAESGQYELVDGQWQPAGLGLLPAAAEGDLLELLQASDGRHWAYGASGIHRQNADGGWQTLPLRHLRRGTLMSHRLEPGGGLSLVTTHQLLLYRPRAIDDLPPVEPPQVSLRAVTQVFPDGRQQPLSLSRGDPLSLPAGDYALSFQFALPELRVPGGARYQARLQGYNEPWSEWSRSRGFSYSRLRPGEYSLELRARDAAGVESLIEPFAFRIEPPWYQRSWVQLLALLAALAAGGWGLRWFVRQRLRRLDADRLRLADLVDERTRELASANRRLEQIAHQDGLTGIANRRRLDDYLELAWERAAAAGESLAVLAIDVDHFKAYNDSQGHLAGDELLKALVPILAGAVRDEEDLLARFGGEEFLVVLPRLSEAEAAQVAERLRQRVQAAALGATISIGVASRPARGDGVQPLLHAADRALYAAKDAGRNRIALASTLAAPAAG